MSGHEKLTPEPGDRVRDGAVICSAWTRERWDAKCGREAAGRDDRGEALCKPHLAGRARSQRAVEKRADERRARGENDARVAARVASVAARLGIHGRPYRLPWLSGPEPWLRDDMALFAIADLEALAERLDEEVGR